MNYLSEEDAILRIQQVMNKQFNDEQLAILRTPGGLSIAAVAGSGKTTTLTALIAKRILTGEIPDPTKILVTTFSKAGATELEERLSSLLIALGLTSAKVTTLHAACYHILLHFGITPNIISDGENFGIISQAVSQALGKRTYLESEELESLASAISIIDNSLLSVSELMVSGKYLLDYDEKTLTDIINIYRQTKAMMGKHTFDDLLVGVYQWLCVAKADVVLQYVREQYKYLFLDEFQDTNKVQFETIKAILNLDPATKPQDRIVVVGDDDQNIYEWRGTDPRIMINIRTVVELKKMNLSINYRCKSNISNLAMNCVRNMGTRQEKTMQPMPGNEGGIVELLDPNEIKPSITYRTDLVNYSQLIVDRIMKDIQEGTITQRRACILARTNAEMAILANMLLQRNISVKQLSGMCISRGLVWQAFKQIVDLAKPFTGPLKMHGLLYQIVPYASTRLENVINDISTECQCSIDYAIQYLFEVINYDYYVRYYKDNFEEGDDAQAGGGVEKISVKTSAAAEYVLQRFKAHDELIEFANILRSKNRLAGLLDLWYNCLIEQQGRVMLAFKDYLCAMAKQYDDPSDLAKFIYYTEQVENCSGKASHYNNVEIRTIHGSKGMEWPIVYILADENRSFPDFNKIKALCNTRGIEYSTVKDVIDSERRLHYVAQTRAKNELYFVANRKYASVFVEETFGYQYTPNADVVQKASMQNRDLNDENGRIIYKAEHDDIKASCLANNTSIID